MRPRNATRDAVSLPLRVADIDIAHDPRWDAYVESHPDRLVFHHSRWLATLHQEYGRRPVGLAAVDENGDLRGVLPLMSTRGIPVPGFGRRLSSLPRTPVAGPLGDDRDAVALLVQGAIERLPDGCGLQLKRGEPDLDAVHPELTGHAWRTSFVLELPQAPDEVRFGNSRNHARLRWAVNKATKAGVVVRHADDRRDLARWYPLYLETMRHHMLPPRPWRLFSAMWDLLRPHGMMRLLVAERENELLAGSILVMHGATVFYLFNGAHRDAFALRPNDVIQWQAIHECAAEGYRRYDFGEVAEHHVGLSDFKRKWGTHEHRLHRYYHPAPAHPPDTADVRGRAAEAALRAWRHVPLPLTRLAGDVAYRFL